MAVALSQSHYRFGVDDGTESTHSWYAPEDSPCSLPLDTTCLLRVAVQETGGTAAANLVQQFQFSNNGGSNWTNITASSAGVRAANAASFANGDDCTQRLSGSGSFRANNDGCTEDGSSGGNQNDVSASGCTETMLAFQIRSDTFSAGEQILFRLTVSGPTGTISYGVTPTANVKIDESPAVAPVAFAGQAPSRVVNYIAAVAVGAMAMAGLQPTATVAVPGTPISVNSGSVSLAGQAPKIPTLTVYLKDGGVTRATRYVNLSGSQATTEFELSTEERDSIEAWGNLSLSFVANSGQAEVAWAELETPDATDTLSEAPSLGAMALTGLAPTATAGAPGLSESPGAGSMSVAGTAPVLPSFTVQLYVGDTSVASQKLEMYGSGIATYEVEVPTTSISDWSTLRVSLTANVRQVEVTWVEVEVPESAGAVTSSPAYVALALDGLAPTAIAAETSPLTVSPGAGTMAFVGLVPPSGTVSLYMGPSATGTLITTRSLSSLTDTLATHSFVLTDAEFAAITDWSDLHVVITADGEQLTISWIALEAPDRGTFPTTGSLSFAGLAPLPGPLRVGTPASASFSGVAPTLDRTYLVTPPAGSMAAAGLTVAPLGISDPPRGTMALTGLFPAIATGPVPMNIPVGIGELVAAGIAPTPTQQLYEAPGSGAITTSGIAPSFGRTILVPAGAVSLVGRTPLVYETSLVAISAAVDAVDLALAGGAVVVVQAAIGPVALSWGDESLVIAGCDSGTLVPAKLTSDALEYAT